MVRLVDVKMLHVHHLNRNWVYRNCFKIRQDFPDPRDRMGFLTEADGIMLGEFWIDLIETGMNNSAVDPSTVAELYVTSEANAYGPVTKVWYDGTVDPFTLKIGFFHNLSIPEVKEYRYLKESPSNGPCSEQSFYQCLSSNLAISTTCGDEPCMAYSLPEGLFMCFLYEFL